MSNPYLPITFAPDNYGLTVFQPDQVLLASQLNTLFGFLLDDQQRTRTRLLGVGVMCGFSVSATASALTVQPGVGVPSGGDLIILEQAKTLTHARPYTLNGAYVPFSGVTLWEATVDEPTARVRPQPLTGLSLTDKVVVLFLESALEEADECTGVACDNKGDAFNNRLRVLLTTQADAVRLLSADLRQRAAAPWRLPILTMPRVGLNDLPYNSSLSRFRAFIDRAVTTFSSGLQQAYGFVNAVAGIQDPAAALRKLREVADSHTDARIQYVYDWLHDLHDAYEAFRQATEHWLVQCLPDADGFPKHLLLGELNVAAGQPRPLYRHPWLRAPGVATPADARQRTVWYYERILRLLNSFSLPSAIADTFTITGRGTVVTLSTTITPDRWRTAPFDERSMPFYYVPALRPGWSYPLVQRGQVERLLSFHQPNSAPDAVQRPFRYAIETYPFYRIEGILGGPVNQVLETVLELRRQHNLAFEVLALRADTQQRLITQDGDEDAPDVGALGGLRPQPRPQDVALLARRVQLMRDGFRSLGLSDADPNLAFDLDDAQLETRLNDLERRITDAEANAVADVADARAVKGLRGHLMGLKRLLSTGRGKNTRTAHDTFGTFLAVHPGIDHGAGVPRGGTFILVYKDSDAAGKTGQSVVVADFYLPYIINARGPAVQFVLPEPAPFIHITKQRFVANEPPALVSVSPVGGTLQGGNVRRQDDAFLFTPDAVGQFTLTYTAPNGKTASVTVEVVAAGPAPVARFAVARQDRQGDQLVVVFTNQATNATSVTWLFGDGQQQEIALSTSVNGNVTHSYALNPDGSGRFVVELRATNGTQTVSTTQTITVAALPPAQPAPTIKLPPVLCFNERDERKAEGDPAGGKFTSDTLDIKETGEFVPNKPGPHRITYTATDGQAAQARTFILPGDFEVENVKEGRDGTTFEVVLVGVPKTFTLAWALDDKAIEPKDPKDEDETHVRLFFSADSFDRATLTLTILLRDRRTCPPIEKEITIR